ncbi:MAG TPA: hypothetical protein DDZ51_05935 [Planctomycetaceae bacterium]|nr:hypothetical protein [Planctomycetaceae bacterium]
MNEVRSIDRLEIWKTVIKRPENQGSRSVYFAFLANEAENRIIGFATVADGEFNNLDWIYVQEDWRRHYAATQILKAIESHGYELKLRGVTPEGEAFSEAYKKSVPRKGLINEVPSHILTKTSRFEIWRSKIQRTAGNHFDLIQVWQSVDDVSRPVNIMVIDPAMSCYLEYLSVDDSYDNIDWDIESPKVLAAIEAELGQLEYCVGSAINGVPGRQYDEEEHTLD